MTAAPATGQRSATSLSVSVHCHMDDVPGWRRHQAQGLVLWFKGYLNGNSVEDLASRLAVLPCEDWLQETAGLDGHFALIAARNDTVFAAVDSIASIPVFYGLDGAAWHVDGNVRRLAVVLGATKVNSEAALALAMSGATIGPATLLDGIEALGAGEAVLFAPGQEPQRRRLYQIGRAHV